MPLIIAQRTNGAVIGKSAKLTMKASTAQMQAVEVSLSVSYLDSIIKNTRD